MYKIGPYCFTFVYPKYNQDYPYLELPNIPLAIYPLISKVTAFSYAVENVLSLLWHLNPKELLFEEQAEFLQQWAQIAKAIGAKKTEEYWMIMIGMNRTFDIKIFAADQFSTM